ncbi:TPA: tail fiber assembly protein, partial [Citrobacter freundii]|nr:tail fiber assembly protein [Citrobacter freundii]HED3677232.1 tail fiber assembly protein [Citrobacter freundii]
QQIRDYLANSEAERNSRMNEATARINWLSAAQEDGDITDKEEAELTALRAYRTALRRLDFSNVTDKESYIAINWPEKPE